MLHCSPDHLTFKALCMLCGQQHDVAFEMAINAAYQASMKSLISQKAVNHLLTTFVCKDCEKHWPSRGLKVGMELSAQVRDLVKRKGRGKRMLIWLEDALAIALFVVAALVVYWLVMVAMGAL